MEDSRARRETSGEKVNDSLRKLIACAGKGKCATGMGRRCCDGKGAIARRPGGGSMDESSEVQVMDKHGNRMVDNPMPKWGVKKGGRKGGTVDRRAGLGTTVK